MTVPLFIALIISTPVLRGEEVRWDWRAALLKKEGIESTPEGLRRALEKKKPASPQIEEDLQQLGSAKFEEREAAQKNLLRGGEETYRWLKNRKSERDPEVRKRIENIILQLGLDQRKELDDALQFAIKSLLEEGPERRKDTGGRFYEWFGEEAKSLENGYHLFELENPIKRICRVSDARLILEGDEIKDGAQRLVLRSKSWPGRDTFGDRFEVSAKLGGEIKSSGSWHLGISIGNVRALYHPGYRGGGFRFETVSNTEQLSQMTIDMGFTPADKLLEKMTVQVQKLADGKVSLKVTVREQGPNPKTFTKRVLVPAEKIGPLDQIGLDRSGRRGGSAFFSDFSVVLDP